MNDNFTKGESPIKSMSNKKKRIIGLSGAIGAVILCCCSILAYGASVDDTSDEDVIRVEQTSEIEVTTPTPTFVSTNTPPAILPTPVLTNTPIPTFASTNTPPAILPTLVLTNTSIPIPTNTPIPPTATNIPASPTPLEPTVDSYKSGGLGLPKVEWEQEHIETPLDWGFGTGYDNSYDVLFQQDNVWMIQKQWDTDQSGTLDEIELISSQLIPDDGEYIKTYTPEGRPETTVLVYISDSLATRFDADFWSYAEPGVFTVQYNTYEGLGIGSMIISIDDNP